MSSEAGSAEQPTTRAEWKDEAARLARENALIKQRLTNIEDELDDLRELVSEDLTRAEKIEQVLDHATRTARGDEALLTYKEVMAAADVSAPTAYSYMEEMVSELNYVEANDRRDGVKRIVVDVASFKPPKTDSHE